MESTANQDSVQVNQFANGYSALSVDSNPNISQIDKCDVMYLPTYFKFDPVEQNNMTSEFKVKVKCVGYYASEINKSVMMMYAKFGDDKTGWTWKSWLPWWWIAMCTGSRNVRMYVQDRRCFKNITRSDGQIAPKYQKWKPFTFNFAWNQEPIFPYEMKRNPALEIEGRFPAVNKPIPHVLIKKSGVSDPFGQDLSHLVTLHTMVESIVFTPASRTTQSHFWTPDNNSSTAPSVAGDRIVQNTVWSTQPELIQVGGGETSEDPKNLAHVMVEQSKQLLNVAWELDPTLKPAGNNKKRQGMAPLTNPSRKNSKKIPEDEPKDPKYFKRPENISAGLVEDTLNLFSEDDLGTLLQTLPTDPTYDLAQFINAQ